MDGQFKISYTNKKNRSGYKIINGMDEKGIKSPCSMNVFKSGEMIVPKKKDALTENVIFDEKVFEEFFKLLSYYKNMDIQAKEILRFYDKYGPLQGQAREKLKDTRDLIDLLRIDDENRKNNEHTLLRYQMPRQEYEHWEDGKILLTFKPKTLSEAIFTAWAFHWNTAGLTKCKHLEEFGPRKKCKNFFQKEHASKVFCTSGCRKAYHDKREKL